MPNPAKPITKLAAAMTPAAAAHASVTRSRSVARGWEGAGLPPWVERRQVRARPQQEPRRALLEEGAAALPGVGGASGPEHCQGAEAMPLRRGVGAEEPPPPLPRPRPRARGPVPADLQRRPAG